MTQAFALDNQRSSMLDAETEPREMRAKSEGKPTFPTQSLSTGSVDLALKAFL